MHVFGNQEKIWLSWITDIKTSQEGIIALISNLQGYSSIYTNNGEFLGNLELNERLNFSQPLTLLEIISSTGLQIKTDPGIPLIYFGFLCLMSSSLISYITYSQIWMIEKDEQIFIGGNTNRAIFEFELEFLKFIK